MAACHPPRRTRVNNFSVGTALACALMVCVAGAQPYVPASDDQVLEQLSNPVGEAGLRDLRAELGQRPDDLALALRLARQHIEQARVSGDPRHLGRAEAVLSPWWDNAQPPVSVLLMRAILRQANHDFDAALVDLGQVLERDASDPQAWLTRASVFRVRGDYANAQRDCRGLAQLRRDFIAEICLADIASLSGRAEMAYVLLEQLARSTPAIASGTRVWIEGLLADIAERRGDTVAAEQHYRAALAGDATDLYLLTAFADFLLDQERAGEVAALLQAHRDADSALLRLALAARATAAPEAAAYIADMAQRFAASRQRGSNLHLREEARFTLSILNDPGAALPLAIANWAQQHEPEDARLLLQAAAATRQPEAARPALAWLALTGMEDIRLRSVVSGFRQ